MRFSAGFSAVLFAFSSSSSCPWAKRTAYATADISFVNHAGPVSMSPRFRQTKCSAGQLRLCCRSPCPIPRKSSA